MSRCVLAGISRYPLCSGSQAGGFDSAGGVADGASDGPGGVGVVIAMVDGAGVGTVAGNVTVLARARDLVEVWKMQDGAATSTYLTRGNKYT